MINDKPPPHWTRVVKLLLVGLRAQIVEILSVIWQLRLNAHAAMRLILDVVTVSRQHADNLTVANVAQITLIASPLQFTLECPNLTHENHNVFGISSSLSVLVVDLFSENP